MKVQAVLFPAPWKVEFAERDLDEASMSADQVLVETECSVVSAGTELAILSGGENWAKLPFVPGYGAVGRVLKAGKDVKDFKPGDRVFYHGPHQSKSFARGLLLLVPDGLDPQDAVLARMGQVAFTSVRASGVELGDTVAVQGLGLVGNFAAQLFTLAGCTVIGIDVSEKRLAAARACGVAHTVNSKTQDAEQAVRAITGGQLCEAVVEATGVSDLAVTAARLCGPGGKVVLLGTPRAKFAGDGLDLLRRIHISSFNVTFTGGHEWRYPLLQAQAGAQKHSIERNVRQLLSSIKDGRLKLKPLVTHVLPPQKCVEVYEALKNRNEDYVGVVFDWRSNT